MSIPATPLSIATQWLASYSSALQDGDANAVAASFLADGWLRDVLVFTWDTRALEGREKISHYLSQHMSSTKMYGLKLVDDDEHLRPAYFQSGSAQGISFGYSFETPIAWGKGFVQLLQEPGSGDWKAQIASAMLTDLKGHEEPGRQNFEDFVHGLPWPVYYAQYKAKVEADPYVVVVGAGQVGLNIAARFKQMDIPTLVVENNDRIGDNWRQRYDSLALHTIPEHHRFLYQPFPTNWPTYPPRDRVANWLETYALTQELVIWMKSRPVGRPTYSKDTGKWTLTVDRDGHEVVLHPAHIVLATGTLGAPYVPPLDDRDTFTGPVVHSTAYQNAEPYAGKRVVVVGSGQSAADICEELARAGIAVTMVQRSPTEVSGRDWQMEKTLKNWFPRDVPAEVSDFKTLSVPRGLLRKQYMSEDEMQQYLAAQTTLHEQLSKAGVLLDKSAPQIILWWTRLGGYWLDKGAAKYFASGDIKVRAGVEPKAFTKTGLLLSDGSELPADAVILATGFVRIREVNKKLFGTDVIDQTSPVWGMDEEGEICGSYRPSGYPGLWYASGDFFNARAMSKPLALQIKARELGIIKA